MADRILVINDTQEILDLFRTLLEDEGGYDVVLYSFAILDMRQIERINPDLIILDFIFGTENLGWQMVQKLKMDRKTAQVPVIVCTAAIREVRDIEGYLQSKGVRVVPKPFDIDTLLDTVSRALTIDPHHDAALLAARSENQSDDGSDAGRRRKGEGVASGDDKERPEKN